MEPVYNPPDKSDAGRDMQDEAVYIGQKVKIRMPKDQESEEYYYLKYYCAHLLSKAGEIEKISTTQANKVICEVNFHGERLLFHPSGLNLL